ncbi:alpha/beta fold hydrolase [Ottowia thiooxydans]|uniref:Pimeloyl-ACP methyl ester carboxylesterase n=1 Tax=Ottowia thiooxydans TaxID=219182 RepID=A0ABV2Q3X2_9BURK
MTGIPGQPALPTFLSRGAPEAQALVLLHGIGSTSLGWHGQLNAFPGRRVLAWNAPGYGESDPLPSAQPLAQDYAGALLALLDSEGIRETALVASSWGTPIAIALAVLQPARIKHLILSGPSAGYGALPSHQRSELLTARGDRARALGISAMLEQDAPRLVASGLHAAGRQQLILARQGVTLDGYLQALHALAAADAPSGLRQLACPALIVYGEQDAIAPPPEHALRLAEAMPSAQLHAFPQCGHLPHLEHPERFNDLVEAFIKS